ncbi:hypothetical protein AMS68_003001 [Peltaster fructicola]|uniref:Uncharacterized protein n=1 Tax=Peltaster fructicola TaxID=286661 RepID=A0A6H0XRX1_9PEZI|nr:hypothetical protein AMS68_003001 [Peltaster fructicola]
MLFCAIVVPPTQVKRERAAQNALQCQPRNAIELPPHARPELTTLNQRALKGFLAPTKSSMAKSTTTSLHIPSRLSRMGKASSPESRKVPQEKGAVLQASTSARQQPARGVAQSRRQINLAQHFPPPPPPPPPSSSATTEIRHSTRHSVQAKTRIRVDGLQSTQAAVMSSFTSVSSREYLASFSINNSKPRALVSMSSAPTLNTNKPLPVTPGSRTKTRECIHTGQSTRRPQLRSFSRSGRRRLASRIALPATARATLVDVKTPHNFGSSSSEGTLGTTDDDDQDEVQTPSEHMSLCGKEKKQRLPNCSAEVDHDHANFHHLEGHQSVVTTPQRRTQQHERTLALLEGRAEQPYIPSTPLILRQAIEASLRTSQQSPQHRHNTSPRREPATPKTFVPQAPPASTQHHSQATPVSATFIGSGPSTPQQDRQKSLNSKELVSPALTATSFHNSHKSAKPKRAITRALSKIPTYLRMKRGQPEFVMQVPKRQAGSPVGSRTAASAPLIESTFATPDKTLIAAVRGTANKEQDLRRKCEQLQLAVALSDAIIDAKEAEAHKTRLEQAAFEAAKSAEILREMAELRRVAARRMLEEIVSPRLQ